MASGRVFRRVVNGKQQKTWTVQYDAPPDQNGRRKQKMKSGFKTKAEAQAFLAAVQTEINTGSYVEPNKMTFAEYLDYWLQNYAKQRYRETTYRIREIKLSAYRETYKLFSMRLCDIKPLHIQEFVNAEMAKGLKGNTIRNVYGIVHTPLQQAVKWGILANNPANAIELPKQTRKKVQSLTPDQLAKLLERTAGKPEHDFYLFAVLTGLRRGEILGLEWKSVDLEKGVISVHRTLNHVNGTGVVFQEVTKTDSGMRNVLISDDVISLLKKIKLKQAKDKLKYGSAYANTDLVFTKEDGSPCSPSWITHMFKRRIRDLGFDDLNLHSLRHTHATFLLSQGVNIKVISERLGHKDASMTLDIYSHALPEDQKVATEKLSNFLHKSGIMA